MAVKLAEIGEKRIIVRKVESVETMTNQEMGEKLRDRRKMLRLRQRDLAELAGVTLRGLTDLERGNANPTINQLAKVAEVLGLEVRLMERSAHV
jgi:DNA-binding XRE family transcriptional regulator